MICISDMMRLRPILKGVSFAGRSRRNGLRLVGPSVGQVHHRRLLFRFYDVTGARCGSNGQDVREM